ncbi:putative aquaporin [Phlyctochytrium arcticum]|nr:putative aquaporin [Phlyctochytrium arcticum]
MSLKSQQQQQQQSMSIHDRKSVVSQDTLDTRRRPPSSTWRQWTGHWMHILRQERAEFLGTLVMLLFGDGVVAQVVLHEGKGDYLSINLAWGFGVLFGIYATGGISGAHLNPAVTLANAVFNKFPWRKVPSFMLSQILGAFCAAALVYLNYQPAIAAFDPSLTTTGLKSTAGIFATYPQPYLSTAQAFFCEFFATALLIVGLFSIGESRSPAAPSSHGPLACGFLVMAIGMAFGAPTGYAMNPARDFGPRLFTLVVGYGTAPFTVSNYYFWIPIVGPLLGCIAGGLAYSCLLSFPPPPPKSLVICDLDAETCHPLP